MKEQFVRCAVETTPRTKMGSQRFLFIVPSVHPVVSNSFPLCTWNYRIKEELNAVALLTTLQRLVVVWNFIELAFYVKRGMKIQISNWWTATRWLFANGHGIMFHMILRWFIPVMFWIVRFTVNPVRPNNYLFSITSTTCFGLKDHHQVEQE